MKKKSILIIDGCPLICEAYKSILHSINKKDSYCFDTKMAHCMPSAYRIIKNKIPLDILILELKFPLHDNQEKLSGENLAITIRRTLPNTKIIIATTFDDNFRIHSIFKTINPDGFILKKDLTSSEFKRAIHSVINEDPFYSKSILKLLRKEISSNFSIDSMDRKILYELSIGARMIDMPNYIPLSAASIEKRKRHLKKVFNVKDKGDRELILIAKEKGFI
ncbi:response regulator transcription factor [Tenacibaculum finnmarkense]|uniref:DNA-binding response regulator n=1 Tax=Tenacibaculum finnmarkense TaxID=2781243 RepID=UPI001E404D41|nr:DNA-binding response regulator [Tenacibaculum finnmarkense]MCG8812002.1 response regulator transcription factor [Tenacibaculum finnmarkense]